MFYLLRQNNQDPPEHPDEVDEQVERVHHEVLVPHATLLDDELGVVQHEAAHHQQTEVEVRLVQQLGAEEYVHQRQDEDGVQHRHQNAAQVQPLAARGEHGADGKRDEYQGGADERGHDERRIDVGDVVEDRSQAHAAHPGEAEQVEDA